MKPARVAVLGGGLQGACIALELACRRIRVDLYEQNELCMTGSSAQSEGKIHLGFVYANDPTLATARRMVEGARSFAPLMRKWLGVEFDSLPISSPFFYLVHSQSLLDAEYIEGFLRKVQQSHADFSARDYFGQDLLAPVRRLSAAERGNLFDSRQIKAAFQTSEIAIDPESIAVAIRARLAADPYICVFCGTKVLAVNRNAEHLTVKVVSAEGARQECYEHVVNALLDGRLAIDAGLGLIPNRRWLFRHKHFLRVRTKLPSATPSATIVLGPFGDVVDYGTEDLFLSWYPLGMRGMSGELVPPPVEPLTAAERNLIRTGIFAALSNLVLNLRGIDETAVETADIRGGYIFAWGNADIDVASSELHRRFEIGPTADGNYQTVDTGKFTMAPFFAMQVARRIQESL